MRIQNHKKEKKLNEQQKVPSPEVLMRFQVAFAA
jgi:hypothetical protein